MHFEGEFRVPGKPDDVIRRFADVERMARCMPGAVMEAAATTARGRRDGGGVRPEEDQFPGPGHHEFDTAAQTGTLPGAVPLTCAPRGSA